MPVIGRLVENVFVARNSLIATRADVGVGPYR
jgi:hypothetical protein